MMRSYGRISPEEGPYTGTDDRRFLLECQILARYLTKILESNKASRQ